ncbi:MAG: Vms1/Ankzf1 family peptidyl-tRNA hydrolase [Dehalococcoidales bacterium]
MLTLKNYKLTREKTGVFLQGLANQKADALTVFLPSGMTTDEVAAFLQKTPKTESIPYDAVRLAATSPTGSVLFWGISQKSIISPPFPIKEKYITGGYETEPLLSLISRDYTIGIVLVRLGHFSVGVCRGEKLLLHDSGTGLIHGRHRQGGSSAARFQRRRKDQTHHFLERVSEHLQEQLEPYARTLDYFVFGGARVTILRLQKQCPFLAQFENRLLPPLLEVPDPHFTVLEKAVTEIWSSKVTEWKEDSSG